MQTQIIDKVTAQELLHKVNTILFDMDGVLWRGSKPIDGVAATLTYLHSLDKRLFFVTNNSSESRAKYLEKIQNFGLQIGVDEIVTSGFLMATWLKQHLPAGKEAYVIGLPGLMEELRLQGIPCFGGPQDTNDAIDFHESLPDEDRPVGAVVIGFDPGFNYLKMAKAKHYLSNPECLFIAANTDSTYPGERYDYPGTGCIVRAIELASGRDALIMGKPNAGAWKALQESIQFSGKLLQPVTTLMVGDRIETDILFGRSCGLWTLLVESGIDKATDIPTKCPTPQHLPHYIAPSVAIFLPS